MSIYVWYLGAIAIIGLSFWWAWRIFTKREAVSFHAFNWFWFAVVFAVISFNAYQRPNLVSEHAWLVLLALACGYALLAIASFIRAKWSWGWVETLQSIVLLYVIILEFGESSFPFVGAGINILALLWFAAMILKGEIDATSPASWGMWMILDAILTGASYFAAPTELRWLLPLGWTLGALAVMSACLIRGKFSWGGRETLCAVLAGVAAYFWLTINAEAGVVAGAIAITLAGIPLLGDMWKEPNRGLLPVPVVTCVACTLFIVNADGNLAKALLPVANFLYNTVLIGFLLRKK